MDTAQTRKLRNALVADLKAEGHIRSDAVGRAMRAVPRHVFIPWRDPKDAYRKTEGALVDPDTTPETLSTVSQPAGVALMLEGFELQSGLRVIEIGAGSGYNAALMAHIVGESGRVTTVDIEDFLVEKARRQLAATGFERIQVVCGDGALGYPPSAPYNRIVATVGLPDIPPAWLAQLAEGGKITLPLHLAGEPSDHELVTLERKGNHLEGVGLTSLQMVLFGSDEAKYDREITRQRGKAWQGTTVDKLKIAIYPAQASVPLGEAQLHIRKPDSITVLEALEPPTQR